MGMYYIVIVLINVLTCVILWLIQSPDKTTEVSKCLRLQKWSHAILAFFGMIGIIVCTVFGTASTVKLIMRIVFGVTFCIAAVLQVWAIRLIRK